MQQQHDVPGESESAPTPTMESLPVDALLLILQRIAPEDIPSVMLVCRRLHALRAFYVPHVLHRWLFFECE